MSTKRIEETAARRVNGMALVEAFKMASQQAVENGSINVDRLMQALRASEPFKSWPGALRLRQRSQNRAASAASRKSTQEQTTSEEPSSEASTATGGMTLEELKSFKADLLAAVVGRAWVDESPDDPTTPGMTDGKWEGESYCTTAF
ncbi:MAG TPA: hypothetical protein VE842_09060 [Pyrinomonadaceae bacterium]|nr:hypothetical protein [Pyrinomonadaceae bacterium]